MVDAVPDAERALAFLRTYQYEVAVLDWRLPGMSGLDVVKDLRRRGSSLPVLMLTARDTTAERVEGLDAGTDDYLVKPFDFDELLARLRALQRRAPATQPPTLVLGDLSLDPATRKVRIGAEQPILTKTEIAILELLLRKSPAVVNRRTIALNAWDDEADAVGSNTIDVHLARLRAKIAASHVRIETVRGIGYRITSDG